MDENAAMKELLFAYEAVLTEMRTHARASRLIAEWVGRLDFHRDEVAAAIPMIQAVPKCAEPSPDTTKF